MFEILYVWMKAQEASIVALNTSDAISSLSCTSTTVTTTFTAPYILWTANVQKHIWTCNNACISLLTSSRVMVPIL